MNEQNFLAALKNNCTDELTWWALADWLEENGEGNRGELVRLVCRLRNQPVLRRTKVRRKLEDQVAALLASGVRPVVPEIVNSIGMRLALIPPGRFRMGSPVSEKYRKAGEKLHEVEITRPFYLGVFPVTQQQWQEVMGDNPSFCCATGRGRDRLDGMETTDFPVEAVSWYDAQLFLKKLSERREEQRQGRNYRLPTEAEWEYSCRAGNCSLAPFHFGDSLASTQANFNGKQPYGKADPDEFLCRTCVVGSYKPNAFGLYDMHGSVWEWCSDWYCECLSTRGTTCDPTGPPMGTYRVMRGGGWGNGGWICRSAYRSPAEPKWPGKPSTRNFQVGFRVAMVYQ